MKIIEQSDNTRKWLTATLAMVEVIVLLAAWGADLPQAKSHPGHIRLVT